MIHYGGCMEERKIRIETELEVNSEFTICIEKWGKTEFSDSQKN